ncbi:MAG: histidine phosphatase family protein [Chlorobi bacterium]|nr:histidine phosphatase family protein [Chlorobiota bacterium]
MIKSFFFYTLLFILLSVDAFAISKIYLIRHATVEIENPGWCNTKCIHNYKEQYNKNCIQDFDPEIVLKKIDHPETIDTVFCSPQLRAVQTATWLFNNRVNLKTNENLMELDYPVIQLPLIIVPVKIWQAISLISWMAGSNQNDKPTYKQRKQKLEDFSKEIIDYAETYGKSVIVAHGVVNRELIKILKKEGWEFEHRDGYKNLSVNCMVK